MTEKQVTKAILKWLKTYHWHIVCFDFPQSGTGKMLHPNNAVSEKNKETIIPDIVAVKDNICIFMENKDRFYLPDYEKQHSLKIDNNYSTSISMLLKNFNVDHIFYGIGLPTNKYKNSARNATHLVDFILTVDVNKNICILHNSAKIVFE